MQRVEIEPMREKQVDEAVRLIDISMNSDEAAWARKSMEFYFACGGHGIDSGRDYYVWREQGQIFGLIGLHRYIWGPEENVWLSWFAVHPEHQGRGAGAALIKEIRERASRAGYKKLLVETYDSPTFEKARRFYMANGFERSGRIDNYLRDGSAMIVLAMQIGS